MDTLLETPLGSVTLRPAMDDDAAALRDLRLQALYDHPSVFGSDHATYADRPLTFWVDWLRQRSNHEDQLIYVAATAESLAGMVGVYRSTQPKTRHNGYVWGVYVRPEWRGLRLTDKLIALGADWAQQHGVQILKLAAVTTNATVVRCYLRCGFSVYGVEPKAIYYAGVYYDELLMARQLDFPG